MFAGSVPRPVSRIADEHYRGFKARNVYVACSGMFTVERHLASIGGWKSIHSNDVIMVSDMVARWSLDEPMPLVFTDKGEERLGWARHHFDESPESALAALLCIAQFTFALRSDDDATPYYRTLLAELKKQFPRMHAETVTALGKAGRVPLTDYFSGDVFEYLDRTTRDDAVVSYPPFYGPRDAANRYIVDYSKLRPLFDWPEPEYTVLDDAALVKLYEKIADRRDWLFAVNIKVQELLPQFAEFHRATIKTSNRGTKFEVYASNGPTRIIAPRQTLDPVKVPHIGPTDEITADSTITLHPLDHGQFSLLRSAYMNHGIRPGTPELMVAVCVDGKLVGCFAYAFGATWANWERDLPAPSDAYLMSDFPVKHSQYDRLAKLIVMAAVSREAQQLCVRRGGKPYRAMTTTAFSKNPVSMKYRGELRLIRRKHNDILEKASYAENLKGDPYYSRPWDLQYGQVLGEHTVDEALQTWVRKHSKALRKSRRDEE